MAGSSWHQTFLKRSLPSRGVQSSLGDRNSSHPGAGRSHHGDTGRAGHSRLPSIQEGTAGNNQGLSSQPGSSRSHRRGGRRSGWHTCRVCSAFRSGQADRFSGMRGLGIQGHTHSCHSRGCRCPHSCRCRRWCSSLPRSPQGRVGGSGALSSQPGTGNVHEMGHSHRHDRSHSGWHSLHQTVHSGKAARSGPPAIQGCRYKLQFGGCRLLHWHTGRWHCTQSPRSQADRAQNSVQAANLPCRRRYHRSASRRVHFRRSSVPSS